jgi:hypothetical protein
MLAARLRILVPRFAVNIGVKNSIKSNDNYIIIANLLSMGYRERGMGKVRGKKGIE